MKASRTGDDVLVLPVGSPSCLPAVLLSSPYAAAELLKINGIADHNSGIAKFSFSAPPRIKPFGSIFGTSPEVCGISADSVSVCFMQYAAQLRIHILCIVAVDDPSGNSVFFCHLQIINVGKTVYIDPDRLIFLRMFYKKCFELLPEPDRILSSGCEMDRAPAHGMDLVLKRHRIIRVAQKIKMKAVQVYPAIIIHEKTLDSAGVFRHTENKNIIHIYPLCIFDIYLILSFPSAFRY